MPVDTPAAIDLLKELDDPTSSGYYQALVQQVRSEASQHIMERLDSVEITESFLFDRLREHFEAAAQN